jgi:hypothetical protein
MTYEELLYEYYMRVGEEWTGDEEDLRERSKNWLW